MTGEELLRFIPKFTVSVDSPGDGCWVWNGGKTSNGYGMFAVDSKPKRAHRLAYQHWCGQIKGEIDHLCHDRLCVNPWHMEDVSRRENLRRGFGANARIVSCKRGHDYTEDNIYISPDGFRHCIMCKNEANRNYRNNLRERNEGLNGRQLRS